MHLHNPKLVELTILLTLTAQACAYPQEEDGVECRTGALETTRDLPYLAGQRIAVTQGNNCIRGYNDAGAPVGHLGALEYGIDFSLPASSDRGLPVVAVGDGVVSEVVSGKKDARCSGWGNTVVYCDNYKQGACERAAHLREVFVGLGERIKKGQVIGVMGNSGESTNVHLHAQHQTGMTGSALATYSFRQTIDAGVTNSTFYGDCVEHSSSPSAPFAISTNEGRFEAKLAELSQQSINLGPSEAPRADLEENEGWHGYGWHKRYVSCDDIHPDSDTICSNEGEYRTNIYTRRFSGGSFGDSVLVYDVLNGATQTYLIHSGFLTDQGSGWESSFCHTVELGSPLSDEYLTSYGSRQDFMWGWLEWNQSQSRVIRHLYPVACKSNLSIGPGVFAPDSEVKEYHWNRQVSYRIADAWKDHGGTLVLGAPYSDNGADAGVHTWATTRFLVQNFTGGTAGDSAIVYDPKNGKYADLMGGSIPEKGWNKAYVVKGALWQWYRYNNGISSLKAPKADEVSTANGSRQDFLCGWLEYDSGTGSVTSHIENSWAGCTSTFAEESEECCLHIAVVDNVSGGAQSALGVIRCEVGPADMTVLITGPIQSGIFTQMSEDPVYIEYGSDTDGWGAYTTGKPKNTWVGDWITAEVARTYMFTLGVNVQNMNFFLYNPNTSQVSWFDLSKWTIVGDCWPDGGGIRHTMPPTTTKTLACQVTGPDMTVTLTGPINQGIFGSPPTDNPTYIEYGSDSDGWAPYTTGKPKATWMSSLNSHTLILSSSVQNMNFFMYGPSSGDVRWFDLDQWNILGDCWRDGGGIRHSSPPTSPKSIDCQVTGPDMTVTLTGPINQGIFGSPPTDNPTYIEYGSDSDGWAPYTTGKPKVTWFNWLNAHTFIISSSVQNMNFFMYGPSSAQVNWFDLNQWTITGSCWRDGGGIRHY